MPPRAAAGRSRLVFISIRRLRAPLIFLVVVLSVSTAGLALIPGVDAAGEPWRPTLFESFYFVTYTATTIGFGELPFTFTNPQRLWVTVIIYLAVIGWAYLLGSLLALFQDAGFQSALVAARFRRGVARIREPFYLLCGLGETGFMVARALDRHGDRFVALDSQEARAAELDLGDFTTDPPALAADMASPETLLLAGLAKPECRGVLALSEHEATNLAVAVTARLLNPGLRAVARAHSAKTVQAMTAVGVAEVINPYTEFAERLALAMRAPDSFRLLTWLTGPPGMDLPARIPAPPGHWIVCGYGRFGSEVVRAIRATGFAVTVVDPDEPDTPQLDVVTGLGSDRPTLEAAGIREAEGLVAGSDDDIANLAMAMAARELNPGIFTIVRQNRAQNRALFEAFGADMTMVPSEIVARTCLAGLRSPHLTQFLGLAYARDNAWAAQIVGALAPRVGGRAPEFWSARIDAEAAPGLTDAIGRVAPAATLADLCRDRSDRSRPLPCLPLLLVRDGVVRDLPPPDMALAPGDELLFAGPEHAWLRMRDTLLNANTAEYILTGRMRPSSVLGRLLARFAPPAPP
jgi:Trk K+ transport system NAD-binding subunit